MSMKRKFGETKETYVFRLADYFTSVGRAVTEISTITFMLKSDRTATDETGDYLALNGPSVLIDEAEETLTVKITSFAGLEVGVKYYIGVGFKFTGDLESRELNLSPDTESVIFTQDVIRG